MKHIYFRTKVDFQFFVECMEKGYSGGGDGKTFKFSTFNGKDIEDFEVSQDLILAYTNYTTAKQILINQLKKEQ